MRRKIPSSSALRASRRRLDTAASPAPPRSWHAPRAPSAVRSVAWRSSRRRTVRADWQSGTACTQRHATRRRFVKPWIGWSGTPVSDGAAQRGGEHRYRRRSDLRHPLADPAAEAFPAAHPNITVHIAERLEPFLLAGSGFDAAIHFEHPAWAGMHRHHLLEEVLVPVCSPAFLADAGAGTSLARCHGFTGGRIRTPGRFMRRSQDRAHQSGSWPALRSPFHADRGGPGRPGVALVPRLYIGAELEQGRLVAPWPDGKAITKNFCLVLPEPIELCETPLPAFAKWLLEEART